MIDLHEVLSSARVVAVVGCSDNPVRTSYRIANYLIEAGYEMIPVNPNHPEVLGKKCYPDLLSVPEDVQVDIVDIFRNSRYSAEAVEDTVRFAAERNQKPVVWTQIGVSSPDAKRRALEAGLKYVENRCIMVEHRRLFK